MNLVRGLSRIIAAVAGVLLTYGVTYALEGVTTRIPTAAIRELAITSMWTAPWMLLFFSGVEDLANSTRKDLLVWIGVVAALLLLYYLDRHTSDSLLTKGLMPPLAVVAGLIPHFIRQLRFLSVLCSIVVAAVGAYILYRVTDAPLFTNIHRTDLGLLVTVFVIAALLSGLLTIFDLYFNLMRPRGSPRTAGE